MQRNALKMAEARRPTDDSTVSLHTHTTSSPTVSNGQPRPHTFARRFLSNERSSFSLYNHVSQCVTIVDDCSREVVK